ncbi:hypothetical protein [Corynebacterium tuberculostearicum]|uniref:hypothetical protein n=1 Tax=Corynebacterium tuberculostearicum TaxID=38304 RepID=UPI001EF4453E|nr:hypothetical protein [Corynebacterium tuberculostearicum]
MPTSLVQSHHHLLASHSILRNVSRGADTTPANRHERLVRRGPRHRRQLEEGHRGPDEHVRVVSSDDFDAAKVSDAKERISSSAAASAAAAKEAEEKRKAAAEAADPYDNSPWAAAGIDPIKITAQSKSVYTLRTYLTASPSSWASGARSSPSTPEDPVRWIIDNDDHDLARVSTWEEVVAAANAGELEVQVHPDNQYSFNGIVRDIEKGPEAVDSDQMARAMRYAPMPRLGRRRFH